MVKVQKDNELYDVPDELLYGISIGNIGHTWTKMENGKVKIGITDYGQKQLKEIVFVELPNPGTAVEKLVFEGTKPISKPTAVIESQKTSIDFFSPLSGIIESKNDEVEDNPSLINQDPYDDGWILVINPSKLEKEKENLWTAEKYAQELEKL